MNSITDTPVKPSRTLQRLQAQLRGSVGKAIEDFAMIAVVASLLTAACFYFSIGIGEAWVLAWFAPLPVLLLAYRQGSGMAVFFAVLLEAAVRRRKAEANPWGEGATTLEWTLSSPPPFHQFSTLPRID